MSTNAGVDSFLELALLSLGSGLRVFSDSGRGICRVLEVGVLLGCRLER